jgi:hypothetical protein
MINGYENDGYELICDICNAEADVMFDSWNEAVEARKDLGWRSEKSNGKWRDVCKCCLDKREEQIQNNQRDLLGF